MNHRSVVASSILKLQFHIINFTSFLDLFCRKLKHFLFESVFGHRGHADLISAVMFPRSTSRGCNINTSLLLLLLSLILVLFHYFCHSYSTGSELSLYLNWNPHSVFSYFSVLLLPAGFWLCDLFISFIYPIFDLSLSLLYSILCIINIVSR